MWNDHGNVPIISILVHHIILRSYFVCTCLKQGSFHGDDVATVLSRFLRAERPTSYDHLHAFLLPLRLFVRHLLAPHSPQPTPPRVCLSVAQQRGVGVACPELYDDDRQTCMYRRRIVVFTAVSSCMLRAIYAALESRL